MDLWLNPNSNFGKYPGNRHRKNCTNSWSLMPSLTQASFYHNPSWLQSYGQRTMTFEPRNEAQKILNCRGKQVPLTPKTQPISTDDYWRECLHPLVESEMRMRSNLNHPVILPTMCNLLTWGTSAKTSEQCLHSHNLGRTPPLLGHWSHGGW